MGGRHPWGGPFPDGHRPPHFEDPSFREPPWNGEEFPPRPPFPPHGEQFPRGDPFYPREPFPPGPHDNEIPHGGGATPLPAPEEFLRRNRSPRRSPPRDGGPAYDKEREFYRRPPTSDREWYPPPGKYPPLGDREEHQRYPPPRERDEHQRYPPPGEREEHQRYPPPEKEGHPRVSGYGEPRGDERFEDVTAPGYLPAVRREREPPARREPVKVDALGRPTPEYYEERIR